MASHYWNFISIRHVAIAAISKNIEHDTSLPASPMGSSCLIKEDLMQD